MLENGRFCANSGPKLDFLGLLGRTHSTDHFRCLTKKVCLRGSTKTSIAGLLHPVVGLIALQSCVGEGVILPPSDEGCDGRDIGGSIS